MRLIKPLNNFLGQLLGDLRGAASVALARIGDQLGITKRCTRGAQGASAAMNE
jgi:hypothetical protein